MEQLMNPLLKLFALLIMMACFAPANAAVDGFDLSSCSVAAEDDGNKGDKDKKKKEGEAEPDCE
jgi:hypothetical protein